MEYYAAMKNGEKSLCVDTNYFPDMLLSEKWQSTKD